MPFLESIPITVDLRSVHTQNLSKCPPDEPPAVAVVVPIALKQLCVKDKASCKAFEKLADFHQLLSGFRLFFSPYPLASSQIQLQHLFTIIPFFACSLVFWRNGCVDGKEDP